jgi:LacI family transcriptional regulator
VSEKTQKRVQVAIEQLGFVRNNAARSLAVGRSSTIGFVLTHLGNSFFVDIARGAEDEAAKTGHALLLADSDVDFRRQEAYLDVFDEARVAGILFAPMDSSLEGIDRVRRHGRKIVLVNYAGGRRDCCSVLVDDERGGYLAARHLIDLGRRKLVFAGGPEDLHAVNDRRRGAWRAVAETKGGVTLDFVAGSGLSAKEGRRIAGELVARGPGGMPDGIVAPSDRIAAGLVYELTGSYGLRVPHDVAVIGYDNNLFANDGNVPLSTVSQPGQEMGRVAARLLLDEIDHPGTHTHRTVLLEPAVIARQSTLGVSEQNAAQLPDPARTYDGLSSPVP